MRTIFLIWIALLPLAGQSLQVTQGAADYQVYQRGPNNAATLKLAGTAAVAAGKDVEARVILAGRPLPGFDWKSAGKITGTAFLAEIANLPAGGPYRLELRVSGSAVLTSVSNLLVGDLWLLAGQSNMEGVGNLENLPLASSQVNSLDMTDVWVTAEDPLHRLPDSRDRVHWRRNPQGLPEKLEGPALDKWIAARRKGAGVGLPFALEMVRRTGVPVGLIPCAHGGTSMDQWDPAKKGDGGDSLYGGMLRRFVLAGGRIKGVLWYQGESDASVKAAPLFEEKFRNLIAAMRADFGQADMPFYYVQIGRHTATAAADVWNQVQQSQLNVETQLANTGMVTCVDCELDDGIHVSTTDFPLLAARLANLATGQTRKGPRPVSAKLDGSVIRVEFAEVNGQLTHKGRLTGFTIHDSVGVALPLIFRQRVSPRNPSVVELLIGGKLPEGAVLRYGAGRDPYVNLLDRAGMAAPVFGPMPITR